MNLFILSLIQREIAQYMMDKHVSKILLEAVQMLCSAKRVLDPDDEVNDRIYKLAHKNHPVTIWCRKSKANFVWTLDLVEELQRVPETYLKHIENTDGLYEMRVQLGTDIFRIFCFFDRGQVVVLVNGFQKKTQRTPKKEIELALKIKAEYESEQ